MEVLIPPKRASGAIPGACARQDLWETEIDFVLLCREGHTGLKAWFVRRPVGSGESWAHTAVQGTVVRDLGPGAGWLGCSGLKGIMKLWAPVAA